MKKICYLFCCLVLVACKSNKKSIVSDSVANLTKPKTDTSKHKDARHFTITPYRLIDAYMVVDTGAYSNEGPMTGGSYAIIKNNGVVVDTIDLDYGMKALGNKTYFYHKLEHEVGSVEDDSNKTLMLQEGNFFLITNNKKTAFNSLTPSFDDYFSSPAVLDAKICYWQITNLDSAGSIKVSAAQFDPLTHNTISYYMLNDTLETDDSGYFPNPYIKNDTIYFDAGKDKLIKFSKTFQSYN